MDAILNETVKPTQIGSHLAVDVVLGKLLGVGAADRRVAGPDKQALDVATHRQLLEGLPIGNPSRDCR